jgi:hypothetical protein
MKKSLIASALLTISFVVPQIASASILDVTDGGTGAGSFTQDYFLLGNGTSPIVASSSPTLFKSLFDNLVIASSTILSTGGSTYDLPYWTGSAWTNTDSKLSFNPAKTFFGSVTGPALTVGNDSDASINIFTRYPDGAAFITANDAPASSGTAGTQLLLYAGKGDGNGNGGTLWLLSGAGAGTGVNGGINIYANDNDSDGGSVNLQTKNSHIHVDPGDGDIEMQAGHDGNVVTLALINGGMSLTNPFGHFYYNNKNHISFEGYAPSVSSGSGDCGSDPTIVGTDNAGRVTVGSGTNGGQCTLTFAQEWDNPPICLAQDETTATLLTLTGVSTTGFTLTGSILEGDTLVYHCMGYM